MRKNNTIKKWFVNWKKKQVEKNDSFIVQSLAAKNSNVISFNIFDHCGPNEVFDDLKLSGRPSKVEILTNLCQVSAESFKNNFYWRTTTFEALYFQTLGTIFVSSIEILVGIWKKKVKAHFWSFAKSHLDLNA